MYLRHIKLCQDDIISAMLSWNGGTKEQDLDMDLMAIMLDKRGRFMHERDLVFYNNHSTRTGALFHTMDQKSGANDIASESILVNLSKIPAYCKYIRFAAIKRAQKNIPGQIILNIGKMDGIFGEKTKDVFAVNLIKTDFEVCYLFEIAKSYDKYMLNIALESLDISFEEALAMYSIEKK